MDLGLRGKRAIITGEPVVATGGAGRAVYY
jgi:hypothetical protein